jgi:hypothetical protein
LPSALDVVRSKRAGDEAVVADAVEAVWQHERTSVKVPPEHHGDESKPPPEAAAVRRVREYADGPGRPNLFDAFSKSEDSFAFVNGQRTRFQKRWFSAIDQILSRRRASPTKAGHRDLLDLLLSLVAASQTKEGWRLPFRALVPRLDPMPN